MDSNTQKSQNRFTFKTLLTVAVTYLGTLVLIAYPLGFATFWVQVWREHTHDAATALYAASLMPVPVVVAKSFVVLGTTLIVIWGVCAIAAKTVASYRVVSVRKAEIEEQLSDSRFIRSFMLGRRWRIWHIFTGLSVAALLPFALELISLNNGTDVFYYGCAVLVAGGGAVIGTLMLCDRPGESLDKRTLYVNVMPVMIGSAVIACLLLVPVLPTKLPMVQFSEGKVKEAALISHSEGYWYVVDNAKAGIIALPDGTVGTATVSEVPESASVT